MELSLVMPVYNEASVIQDSVECLIAYAEGLDLEFELLVVDDGSKDGSGLILAKLEGQQPRLRVLEIEDNAGKGLALKRGVLAAKGTYIVILDADLSTDLDALPRALEHLNRGHPVVIGDRRHPDSILFRRQPPWRERSGGCFNFLARRLIWNSIRDFTCGFKAFQRDAAGELFGELETARWAFDLEILAIARMRGMKVVSIPVSWSHHPDTRVRFPEDALRAFLDLMLIAGRQKSGAYSPSGR